MKRLIRGLLHALIALTGGGVWLALLAAIVVSRSPLGPGESLPRLVPASLGLCLHLSGLDRQAEKFRDDFGRRAARSDAWQKFCRGPFWQELMAKLAGPEKQMGFRLTWPRAMQVLGRDVVAALRWPDAKKQPDVLFLARLRWQANLLTFGAAKLLPQFQSERCSSVDGAFVFDLRDGDKPGWMARIGDVLIVSNRREWLTESIALARKTSRDSLAAMPDYRRARQSVGPDAFVLAFARGQAIPRQVLEPMLLHESKEDDLWLQERNQGLAETLEWLADQESVAVGIAYRDPGTPGGAQWEIRTRFLSREPVRPEPFVLSEDLWESPVFRNVPGPVVAQVAVSVDPRRWWAGPETDATWLRRRTGRIWLEVGRHLPGTFCEKDLLPGLGTVFSAALVEDHQALLDFFMGACLPGVVVLAESKDEGLLLPATERLVQAVSKTLAPSVENRRGYRLKWDPDRIGRQRVFQLTVKQRRARGGTSRERRVLFLEGLVFVRHGLWVASRSEEWGRRMARFRLGRPAAGDQVAFRHMARHLAGPARSVGFVNLQDAAEAARRGWQYRLNLEVTSGQEPSGKKIISAVLQLFDFGEALGTRTTVKERSIENDTILLLRLPGEGA